MESDPELKKSLTLGDTTLLSLGNIIGAGVFVLLGTIIRYSGDVKSVMWVLLAAMAVNLVGALCYAELGTMYSHTNAMEYEAVKDSFGDGVASMSVVVLMGFFLTTIGALALMFGEYLVDDKVMRFYLALGLVFIISVIMYFGIEGSKMVTNTLGSVKMVSIIGLCVACVFVLASKRGEGAAAISKRRLSFDKFVYISFLAIFLFNGYDAVVKMNNEIKEPAQTIPKALLYSLAICFVIYMMIALTVLRLGILSKKPMNELFQYFWDSDVTRVGIYTLGILTIFNTTFISMLALSRFLYGLAHKKNKWLENVNEKFRTPHNCILLVFILSALFLLIGNFESATIWTNIFLIVFLLILMLSVIVLRVTRSDRKRPFKIPLSVGEGIAGAGIPLPIIAGVVMIGVYVLHIGKIISQK